jgi:hypothetical protein
MTQDYILKNIHFEEFSRMVIVKISFRRVISFTIQAIQTIPGFIFWVFEIFLGHEADLGPDPNYLTVTRS